MEIVPMINIVGEFTDKNLSHSRSSNKPSLYSKIISFIFDDEERSHSARH
jgi:hypothetical protein